MRIPWIAIAAFLGGVATAAAQDLKLLGGGELDLRFPSEGATQELSAYLEAERRGLYGGLKGLVANDAAATEFSLYAGYRGESNTGFGYDLSYTRYFYPNDGGDCCGEVGLSLGQTVGEKVGLSTDLTLDPEASLGSVEVGAEYFLTERLTLSANYGLFQRDEDPDERTWDLGASYGLTGEAKLDLRYYDGSEADGHFGLSLTVDSELLGG